MYLEYTKGNLSVNSPEFKILLSIDDLFATQKKLKSDALMGDRKSVV
jgi:hypothetical protein